MGEDKLHFHAQRLINLKEEKKSIDVKIEQEQQIIEKIMKDSADDVVRYPYTEDKDIKIEKSYRRSVKLDKEAVAEELNITEDNVKPEVIMKKIDERKYTFDEYKKNKYEDEKEGVSVRLVKIEKKKKEKK